MAHIRIISEDEAEDQLFEIYDHIQRSRGRLSNILRIQSLDPKALQAHLDLYMTLLFGKGPLGRLERELLAVVVSATNDCGYCITHHSEALGKYADDALVAAAGKDWEKADLSSAQKALCAFAVGLTKDPGADTAAAIQALRDEGFDDQAILQATEIIGYFNFVNRLASGLGVTLEEEEARDYAY